MLHPRQFEVNEAWTFDRTGPADATLLFSASGGCGGLVNFGVRAHVTVPVAIRELTERDSLESLTEFLHRAYAPWAPVDSITLLSINPSTKLLAELRRARAPWQRRMASSSVQFWLAADPACAPVLIGTGSLMWLQRISLRQRYGIGSRLMTWAEE